TTPATLSPRSLHDALPIFQAVCCLFLGGKVGWRPGGQEDRQRASPNELHTCLPRFLETDGDPARAFEYWRLKIRRAPARSTRTRSEEHTSDLQSRENLVCR